MENNTPSGSERRSLFRVVFPVEHRPTITIRAMQFPIIDISETGVRFHNPNGAKLPGDIFQATVVLHDNDPFNIVGRIIRIKDVEAAMMMTIRGIPFRKIIAEQVYLRQLDR